MAWTVYKSTDASAPVLTGVAGDLITLLDAVLVNGYGAKPAAGWTKEFSGTNKAAYRNGAASISRTYWQVLDNAVGTGGAREARTRLYATMSDVDTGTLPVPTAAQSVPGIVLRKSLTLDATARAWCILADDKTAIIILQPLDLLSGVYYNSTAYVGDIYSYLTADAQAAYISGRVQEGASAQSTWDQMFNYGNQVSGGAIMGYIAGSHTGVAGSQACYGITSGFFGGTYIAGGLPYPNPADGSVWIHGPQHVIMGAIATNGVRGHLRGVNIFNHSYTSITDGDTVNGAGELAGKSFILYRATNSGASSTGLFGVGAFETTEPAYSV